MHKILVSGASGIIGYGILRSIKYSNKDVKLIGTTIYPDSIAASFCDIFEQAVPTSDIRYIDWLINIIEKHQINFLIPGIEADMYKWVEHIQEIEETGVKILLNNKDLIKLCNDKWIFFERLNRRNNIYTIETSLDSDFDSIVSRFSLPFLLKPRSGHGSKGIVKVNDWETFVKHKEFIGSVLMVQPIVGTDDEEYTTSAFCDGAGSFYAYMTLRRKLSKEGFTDKAEVIHLANMSDALHALCKEFKPIGPTNFQFRFDNGILKLLEINPRISSATSIRTKFGYNESLMSIEYYLEGKKPEQPLIKNGKAIRYIDEIIIYE